MIAFRSNSEDAFPRSPFQIADELRNTLRTRSPRRFAQTNVRVANGAVALTGCVPNWQSKSLAIRLAREAFAGIHVIDALEVQNRRTFGSAA
jgi:osmotically-inducible protein OsmY